MLLRSNADELEHIVLRLVCSLVQKKKKKNSHSSQKSWCDSRATLANHNHSLSVYQTTHGQLWLLNKKNFKITAINLNLRPVTYQVKSPVLLFPFHPADDDVNEVFRKLLPDTSVCLTLGGGMVGP